MENHPSEFLNESELFELNNGHFVYATFWQRLGSYLIDCLIMIIVTTPIFVFLPSPAVPNTESIVRDNLISNGIWLIYSVLMISSRFQGTLGKLAVGIKVVHEDGGDSLPFPRAIVRFLATIVSFLVFGLGILSIFSDPQKRAWHDKWVGSVVVKR